MAEKRIEMKKTITIPKSNGASTTFFGGRFYALAKELADQLVGEGAAIWEGAKKEVEKKAPKPKIKPAVRSDAAIKPQPQNDGKKG